MKMKKIGILAMSLVLVLGLTGAAFAKWSDTVTIEGTVNTGSVCVGIRDVGTSDSGDTPDQMFDLSTGQPVPVPEEKDVASAESVNGTEKCLHENDQFYQDVTFTVINAYPLYYWEDTIEIANCGSIPVKLDSIEYWNSYATTPGYEPLIGADSFKLWSGSLSDDIWLGSYYLSFPHDLSSPRTGTWYHELMAEFLTLDTQLDHCDVATITLGFFLYEDADSIPEMNATSTMKLRVTFSQWNEV